MYKLTAIATAGLLAAGGVTAVTATNLDTTATATDTAEASVLPVASEPLAVQSVKASVTSTRVHHQHAEVAAELARQHAAAVAAAKARAAAAARAEAARRAAAERASRAAARTPLSSGDPRAIARSMLPQYGWGNDTQFQCLDLLWNRESGWNVYDYNPSSGAYGIPQALPGSKMASAGADWRTNPATQIRWGLGYIQGRYGSPCAAWDHSQAYNYY